MISEKKNQIPLQVSFSGGRTSGFMAKFCKEHFVDRDLHYLFYNTGREREETLEFVLECDRRWDLRITWLESEFHEKGVGVGFRVVDFESASRNGEPFAEGIAKFGLPFQGKSWCSRDLKERLGKAYMRHLGIKHYEVAIGIRADEEHRVNRGTAAREGLIYPLIDLIRVDKSFIRNWWERQDFDLRLKDYEGNCDLCWKKSDRKLFTIIRSQPKLAEWWHKMESDYGNADVFFRKYRSTADMVAASNAGGYELAQDEHESRTQCGLFDEMDIETDCFCKST